LRLARLPYVAAPLAWAELEAAVGLRRDDSLLLLPDEVLGRIDAGDDPWAGAARSRHALQLG
jgi:DNA primase